MEVIFFVLFEQKKRNFGKHIEINSIRITVLINTIETRHSKHTERFRTLKSSFEFMRRLHI